VIPDEWRKRVQAAVESFERRSPGDAKTKDAASILDRGRSSPHARTVF